MSNQLPQVSNNEETNTDPTSETNTKFTPEVNTEIPPKLEINTLESPESQLTWIEYSAICHKGKVREANEDAYLVAPWQDGSEALLVVVADGMGGHRGGKEAADIAIATFKELLNQPLPNDNKELFDLERVWEVLSNKKGVKKLPKV